MLLHLALVAQLAGAAPAASCAAPAAPALDHAIIVVQDLERAASAFRSAGFRIKRGRLHANGLLNLHIKFPDGTALELMTVRGSGADAMARDYVNLLRAGEGGVYVALAVRGIDRVERVTSALHLPVRRSSSGVWQFLSFPEWSPSAAVFFTSGGPTANDPDSIFEHQPRVEGLAEVWLEGGPELSELLRQLGAVDCGAAHAPDGRIGQRWGLSRGSLVIVPLRGTARPRLLGAILRTPGAHAGAAQPHALFWIRYRT